ncbi:hypothetical protein [Desulfovibrio sp. ZJ369]|uniref:hypothetical protein n=1 Tax=Desulfovibrio sp. ZJ369 TaxID=2709793 RepID=UPI0013EA99EE|nr:hypothetical protein [Desulfovibrio sp. ZJ369]
MITRIFAQGFKGLDFDQPLALRTLIMGRVGSGKSSRSLALALLVTGGLPGTGIARTNAEIFKAVGNGDSLTVGVEFDDGVTLERSYKRKKNGAVGCEYRNAGESVPKNLFEVELDRRGVSIADVSAFLALSDAKKVDELFRLFPPAGDVRGLNASILRAREHISKIEGDIRAKEQSCQGIAMSIAELKLPAGSLPEVQAEIATAEREYQTARDDMVREQARLEHEAAACAARDQRAGEPTGPGVGQQLPLRSAARRQPPLPFSLSGQEPSRARQNGAQVQAPPMNTEVLALERVLSALERAGCEGCAARMVLKREIKLLRTAQEAVNG